MTDAMTRMHLLSPDKNGEFKGGLRWEKPAGVDLPKHMKRMSLEDKLRYAYDESSKAKVRADQVGGGASDVFLVGGGYRMMRNVLKRRRERKAAQGASNKVAAEQAQKVAEEAEARERRARVRERKELGGGMQRGVSGEGGSRPSSAQQAEARAKASNEAFRQQQKDARYAGVHKGEHVNAAFYDHNKVMDIISDKFSSRAGGARHYFRRFDVDNDGSVSREEFREGLRQLGIGLSEKQISAVADSVDVNADGSVNYYEFANGVHLHSNTLERNNREQRKERRKPSTDAEHTSLPNVTHQIRPVVKGPTTPKPPLPNLRNRAGVVAGLPDIKATARGEEPSDVLVVGQDEEGYASSEDEDEEKNRRQRREERKRAAREADAAGGEVEAVPKARGEGTTDDWLMCKLWAELEIRLDAPERKEIWKDHDQGALQRMEARLDGHDNARQAESEALAGALGSMKLGDADRKRLRGLLAAQQVKVSPSKGLVELLKEQAELSAARLKGFHINSLQVHAKQGAKQRKASFWEWVRRHKLAGSRAASRAGTSSASSRPSTWGSSRMGSSDPRSGDDMPGSSWQRVKGGGRPRNVHHSSAADANGNQRQALVSIDENAPLYASEAQRLKREKFEDRASIAREDKERRMWRQQANINRKREKEEAWMEQVEQQDFAAQKIAAKPSQRRIHGLGEQRDAVRGSKKTSFVYGKNAEAARLVKSPVKGISVSGRKHHDVHDPFGEAPVHLFDKIDQNLPEDDIGRRRRDYRRSLEVKHSSKRTDFSYLYTDR